MTESEFNDPTGPDASDTPSWLPPGAKQNGDGSITLSNGTVLPAPPPGYSRDPQTGMTVLNPGATPGNSTDMLPGGAYGPQYGPGVGSNAPAAPPPGPGGLTPPPTTGGPDTGSIGSLTAPFTETYTPPTPTALPPAPMFSAPTYTAPPAFSYKDFSAPTADEAQNDPGYAFRVQQGQDQLQRSAAARGVLNTGGTLKDILDYGQNAASQEYQNVFNRDYSTYQTNRGNAVDTYNTNYQTQYLDPYKFAYQGALDSFTPTMTAWQTNAQNVQHNNDMASTYGFNTWLQDYNIFRNQENDSFDKIYKTISQ